MGGTGRLTLDELVDVLKAMHYKHNRDDMIKQIYQLADVDGDGSIDFTEFKRVFGHEFKDGIQPVNEYIQQFRSKDTDCDGFITKEEFKELIRESCDKITDAEVEREFNFFDKDKDRKISQEEFLQSTMRGERMQSIAPEK